MQNTLDRYVVALDRRGASKQTRRLYRGLAKRFLEAVGGLDRVNDDTILAYLDGLRAQKDQDGTRLVSDTRVKYTLGVIVSLCRALKLKRVDVTELAGEYGISKAEKSAAANRRSERVYNEEELDALLSLQPKPGRYMKRDAALVGLAAHGGPRVSELVGLDLSDLDLQKGLVRVAGLKTGRPRLVPINGCAPVLKAYLSERKGDGPLFRSERGNRLSIDQARRIINSALEQHGERGTGRSCHALRHGLGTRLVKKHGHAVAAQILGNSPVTLLRIYTHLDPRRTALEVGAATEA